ncbi:MAG: ABC transporter transmembrane domain-containing protein, partial [Planctomycetota bacterium]
DERQLKEYFSRAGVSIRFRRAKGSDLENRSYLFPSVALMRDGTTLVLAGYQKGGGGTSPTILAVDPTDPDPTPQKLEVHAFLRDWSQRLVLVTRDSGQEAKDRDFGFSWFVAELMHFKWVLLSILVISLLLHGLTFVPIIFIQVALDKVVGYKATSTLTVLAVGVLLALVFNSIFGYVRDYLIRHISDAIEARLSGDIFDKILDLPISGFQHSGSDFESAAMGAGTVRGFLSQQVLGRFFDLTALLVFLPILFAYSWILGSIVLAFAVASGLVSLSLKIIEKKRVKDSGQIRADRGRVLRETISGIDTVKTLSQEPTQRRAWRRTAAMAIRAQDQREQVSSASTHVAALLQQVMTVAIVVTGIWLFFAGMLSAGSIIAVNMLGARVVRPITQAIAVIAEFEQMRTVMQQITQVWQGTPERRGSGTPRRIRGHYELNGVAMNFGESVRALHAVTLTIQPRQRVAVIGPAGAGKSTLLRILQGNLGATGGAVQVDGSPLINLDLEHYRKQVSLVTDSPQFFSGTIEDNLRRARANLSEREIEEAMTLSAFADVLPSIPDGLVATIDAKASSLSSTYRQLLALARALAGDPAVLLLDDALSPIGKELRLKVINNLAAMANHRGIVLVTQDVATITDFEQIIVLDDGNLVGDGRHEELLAHCPTYARLWEIEEKLMEVAGGTAA